MGAIASPQVAAARVLLALGAALAALAAGAQEAGSNVQEPIRLSDGSPLVCIYYFGHWWEPWKSDDEAILRDFARLKDLGFNTICVDHEWSQAIDGDWRLLDREHRLARQAGLQIIPWLSAKVWSDMSDAGRRALVKQWLGVDLLLGVDQDGEPSVVQPYDEATIVAGAGYAARYLDRYEKDGALLHVRWDGGVRPVIALTVELGWGAPSSFDEKTNAMFRAWVRQRYDGGIARLNEAWGTTYAGFDDIDPRDKAIFDYPGRIRHLQTGQAIDGHPQAVEDHVEFRAETLSDCLTKMRARLAQTHPGTVELTEIPYEPLCAHPDAISYRIAYGANISGTDYADIVLIRSADVPAEDSLAALTERNRRTGQRFVMTYRISPAQGPGRTNITDAEALRLFADRTAEHAHAIGYYSWNEMVDVHAAAPGPGSPINNVTVSDADSRRVQERMGMINRRYRELVR